MSTPLHVRTATAAGVDVTLVDWPGADLAEVRWVVPVCRDDRADAARAQVAGRLLLHGPADADLRDRDERGLEEGVLWSATPSVDRVAVSATAPVDRVIWVLEEVLHRLRDPRPVTGAVDHALAAEHDRLTEAGAHREPHLHRLLGRCRWGSEHPYAHAILDPADVAALTPGDVADWARRWTPRGSTLLVLGDLGLAADPEGVVRRLCAPLGGPVDGPPPVAAMPADPGRPAEPGASLPVGPNAPTASLRLWAPAPTRSAPEHLPLHLAVMCLAGYFGSRLTQELRERRGAVYGVTSGFEVLASAATSALSLECPPDRLAEVREVVHAEIADLARRGPSAEELARAVAYAVHAPVVGLATPGAFASAASTVLFAGDGLDLWQRQAGVAATLRPRDVAAAAERWWAPDGLVEVVTDHE